MTIRINAALRNKRWDTVVNGGAAISAFDSGTLEIRTGSQPATADTTLTGTVLATMTLPADAFGAASSGAIAKAGTWQDTSADATGTAGYFTMRDSGSTYRIDGSITVTSGGGDMELDNTSINTAQQVTISTFTLTEPA